jgi:hypothetical protein
MTYLGNSTLNICRDFYINASGKNNSHWPLSS